MQRMFSQPGAILFEFDLGGTADDFEFRTVIQVTGFGALQPDHFAIFFGHILPAS
jgi:hypothetical protein